VVQNAIVRFHLSTVLDALQSNAPVTLISVHAFDLGSVDGIPLCFTDGAALPDGDIVFAAVAEDTPDAYQDGPCAGAAIGVADRDGNLRCLHRLTVDGAWALLSAMLQSRSVAGPRAQ